MNPINRRKVRNFAIEMLIYGALVAGYLFLVIRYLADWLVDLFNSNLIAYAVVALVFIVAQGVVLDSLTTFLMDRLGLEDED